MPTRNRSPESSTRPSQTSAGCSRGASTGSMQPHVAVARIPVDSADGIFTIGREAFPEFNFFKRLGVHVQSDQVRVAHPDPAYVGRALTVLGEACEQLGVPEASIAFVDTVIPPPAVGLRYGF